MFAYAQGLDAYLRVQIRGTDNKDEVHILPQQHIVDFRGEIFNFQIARKCFSFAGNLSPQRLDREPEFAQDRH